MKRHLLQFVVEGSGEFPHDMLRYDSCYPATERDSSQLTYAATCAGEHRKVTLRTRQVDKNWRPTEQRWQSFSWRTLSLELVP